MTKRILLNAGNITGDGAKAIGVGLIPVLPVKMQNFDFFILLPDEEPFTRITYPKNANVIFIKRQKGWVNSFDRVWQLFVVVPLITRRVKPDLLFSLGDLSPAFSACPRIAFVQNALLVYEEHELARIRTWSKRKRFFLTKYFAFISHHQNFIVQTPIMKEHLANRYKVDRGRIDVVTQAVPIHVSSNRDKQEKLSIITDCKKQLRLLFLSAYYLHKNHAILIAVAEELRQQQLTSQVQIFTTLDIEQESSLEIRKLMSNYPDVITNLGHLPRECVVPALKSSTALFLPTLLESYGNIYLEAMSFGLPILTSDRDFAHWITNDLALYFDPFSVESIVNCIKDLPNYLLRINEYRSATQKYLAEFPKDYNETAEKFALVLNKVIDQYDSRKGSN